MTTSQSRFDSWHAGVPKSIRKPALLGLFVLLLSIFGFGVWAATAPLNSAAVAQGVFVATGQNKIVQHLEGGIIKSILVEEGDHVLANQALVEMDGTTARAQVRRLALRRFRLAAMRARLLQERGFSDRIDFPPELVELAGDPKLRAILDDQRSELKARHDKLLSEIDIHDQRILAIREEITGLQAQQTSAEEQLKLIVDEIGGTEKLYKQGLAKLSTLLSLQRAKAQLEGQRGESIADIGRAKERIAETASQIAHTRTQRVEETVEELRKSETELSDVEQQIEAARDIVARLQIRSPVKGVVVRLSHHTAGGVVTPGQEILELLPVDEKLLVEAFVRPEDIDVVQKGDNAQLRLLALKQRTTPTITGQVEYVSADTIEGKRSGEVFYVARIRIGETEMETLSDLTLSPGMPVEVYIETGERTFFEYLASPISDSFSRAFRED